MGSEDDYNYVQYCNNNCVLVINYRGRLKPLYTPFKVYQRNEDGKERWFIVDEVATSKSGLLVYIINQRAYYHHHFTIDAVL
jgi:hypothetical protein